MGKAVLYEHSLEESESLVFSLAVLQSFPLAKLVTQQEEHLPPSYQGSRGPFPLEMGFPGDSDGIESACNAGDRGVIPRSGRSHGEGNKKSLQNSWLENPIDTGAWWPGPWDCIESDRTE